MHESMTAGAAGRLRSLRAADVLASRRVLSFTGFTTALASAFAVAFWVTRPSFGAKFGPIDDHEPLIWMGPDGHLPWSQYWSTLMHTEVAAWGGSGRFRASYYVVRVAEAAAFGANPWSWYACVFVMFAVSCAVFGYTAAIWFTAAVGETSTRVRWSVLLVASAVCPFLFAGMFSWSGIVGRLGPAEQLGMLGTAVLLLSLTKVSIGLSRLWWIPALLGVTIAVFAKESFSSLALAFPLVGTYSYLAFGRRKIDLVVGVLGLAPVLALGLILGPDLLHSQRDVYGNGFGDSRISAALKALPERPLRYPLIAGGVMVFAWLSMVVARRPVERRTAGFLLAVIAWMFASVFLDAWFYHGAYVVPRYRAIVDLATTAPVIGAACLAIVAARRSRRNSRPVLAVAAVSVLVSSLVLVELARSSLSNIRATRSAAAANAVATAEYQQGLSQVLARLANERKASVAVVASYLGDYEPAYAVLNELARRSDYRFREYLIVEHYVRGTSFLLDDLEKISKQGSPGWSNRPVKELAGTRGVMCVFLNQDPHPVKGCRRGAGVRIVAT
jgi:hypothetical protein